MSSVANKMGRLSMPWVTSAQPAALFSDTISLVNDAVAADPGFVAGKGFEVSICRLAQFEQVNEPHGCVERCSLPENADSILTRNIASFKEEIALET
jgi:hypothetical protein